MSFFTTFLEKKDFRKNLFAAFQKFEEIYEKTDIVLNENLYPIQKESYHFLAQILKKSIKENRVEELVATQIFNAIYKSEIISAGAAEIAFLFALQLIKILQKIDCSFLNEHILISDVQKFLEKIKNNFISCSNVASAEDIDNIIEKTCLADVNLSEVIKQAIKLGGFEGKIFVEDGRQNDYYIVEAKEGYTFNLNPYAWMLNENIWERSECKILLVDGLVEKISEIDHLLTKAFETKQSLVVIANGFSEEVGATLKINFDKGLLDVQPVRIPIEIENLNVINDLSVVCGCLPVSSMKGDMLVFTKWDDLAVVEKIKIMKNQVVIENSKTKENVLSQIKFLLEKRNENYLHEEIQNLFDKRIKSLTTNTINIFLPSEETRVEIESKRVQIDIALRHCKTILNYGLVNFKEALLSITPSSDLEKIIYNALLNIKLKNNKVPTLSAIIGITLIANTIINLYVSAGLVLVIQ